ncbi:hypothetical protein TKV_c06000 [Thermoanaerobacter kivui]|uniref:Uncharacterized protein n=2 Tax=Thermoanaerobacter kivui TaxID=2325 RepID=A0A097APQ3_THEKI|nr:hypothetical protein TKV_c06000 [Thermoanaerobacter kivui]
MIPVLQYRKFILLKWRKKNFHKKLYYLSYDIKAQRWSIPVELCRVGFELFKHLFRKFNTEIIVVSEVGNEKLDSQEIIEEIISLLNCYKKSSKNKKTFRK